MILNRRIVFLDVIWRNLNVRCHKLLLSSRIIQLFILGQNLVERSQIHFPTTSYAPNQLLGFLHAVEAGFDVAIGNRHHVEAETLVGTSRLRSFGSRVVNMATNLLLLGNYRDTQCGCKAFRSDAARLVMEVGTVDW